MSRFISFPSARGWTRRSNRMCRRLYSRTTAVRTDSSSQDTTETSTVLHYEWIRPKKLEKKSDLPPIVFLHGLLGNSRNIRTMARAFCITKATHGLLIDITGHGKSASTGPPIVYTQDSAKPVTFDSIVKDIGETVVAALKTEKLSTDTVTLVGHSFGGRLSLHYAANAAAEPEDTEGMYPKPDRVMLLDTVPGHLDQSVLGVLNAAVDIEKKKDVIERDDLTDLLESKIGLAMAQWLASQHDGKRFAFDLSIAQALIEQFADQDFWGQLASVNIPVHLVQGGANPAWSNNALRLELNTFAEGNSNLKKHVLTDAGHWVHVDDLPGLIDIVQSIEEW